MYVSPPNGAVLYREAGRRGLGLLSVDNGTERDAAVVLLNPAGERHITFYIRARQKATARMIAPGTYRVHFRLGTGWLGREFAEREGDFEFVDPLDFREEEHETEEGRQGTYARWNLSLHPVAGGTARTVRASPIELIPPDYAGEAAGQALRPPR